MEHTHHPSHRLLLVGLAAAVALIGAVALVALILANSGKQKDTALVPEKTPTRQVATAEEIRQGMESLEKSLKQAADDHAAASMTLKDKQVKVSS